MKRIFLLTGLLLCICILVPATTFAFGFPILKNYFVAYSKGVTIVQKECVVNSGWVGSNGKVAILLTSTVAYNMWAGGDVDVKYRSKVGGNVFAVGVVNLSSDSVVNGYISEDPNLEMFVYDRRPCKAGVEKVYVNPGETVGLKSGAYGHVIVNGGVLQLHSGVYNLDLLYAINKGIIRLDLSNGPIILNVANSLKLYDSVMVVSSLADGPGDVFINVCGYDGSPVKVINSKCLGTIYAPSSDVWITRNSRLDGAVYAGKKLVVAAHSQLNFVRLLFNPPTSILAVDNAAKQALPGEISLAQNAPNPFNPVTTIEYRLPAGASERVTLKVYDLRGAVVNTLVDHVENAGVHSVVWNGTDGNGNTVSSGVYIYQLRAGDFVQSKKMILMR